MRATLHVLAIAAGLVLIALPPLVVFLLAHHYLWNTRRRSRRRVVARGYTFLVGAAALLVLLEIARKTHRMAIAEAFEGVVTLLAYVGLPMTFGYLLAALGVRPLFPRSEPTSWPEDDDNRSDR